MSEFDRAKERYEKKQSKVVPIKEEPKKPGDSVIITIMDSGNEYTFHFSIEGIKNLRLSGQRGKSQYQQLLEAFVAKEFGRWRLLQTP